MEKSVVFRDFEERDVDFIYRCKNDKELNRMVVGEWHPFSFEEAKNWVKGCMGNHETYKFWAICTNDIEQRIIGWVSLSDIDKLNRSAFFHGIVIADRNYSDGIAWVESNLFIMSYVFEDLKLNRLSGSCLSGHRVSERADIFLWSKEGLFREAVYKNGKYYDVVYHAILRDDYLHNKEVGEYQLSAILRRVRNSKR